MTEPLRVGDIVRDGAGQELLYEGCDEVVVAACDEPADCWDALGFQLEFVRHADDEPPR